LTADQDCAKGRKSWRKLRLVPKLDAIVPRKQVHILVECRGAYEHATVGLVKINCTREVLEHRQADFRAVLVLIALYDDPSAVLVETYKVCASMPGPADVLHPIVTLELKPRCDDADELGRWHRPHVLDTDLREAVMGLLPVQFASVLESGGTLCTSDSCRIRAAASVL
jgi:hypothetical protein